MYRLACTFLVFSLLQVVVPTAGAARKGDRRPSGFSGPTVLVKYVAGSHGQDQWKGQDRLGTTGCLEWSSDSPHNLFFIPYRHPIPKLDKPAGFLAHLFDPSWVKGRGLCTGSPNAQSGPSTPAACSDWDKTNRELCIPLDDVKALARGQVQAMGHSGAGAVETLGTVFGAGGVVAAITSGKLSDGEQIGVSLVGGTVAVVAFGAYLNRRTQNYIAIFYNKAPTTEPELATQSKVITRKLTKPAGATPSKEVTVVTTKTASAPSLFPKCTDFAVFQIIDPHDYWNTSMFLNAKTGLTFVDEAATQGGKGVASGSNPSGDK